MFINQQKSSNWMTRCIDYCAHHPWLVVMLTITALIGSWVAIHRIALDAIPDLSDTQVIITTKWDQSPTIIEDQVTYPIVSSLLGAPKVKTVRGFSDYGYSYVYVIFDEGVDLYWARNRVSEYLGKIQSRLPKGAVPQLGPDASSVGWVLQYALVDKSGKHDLGQLRSLQEWFLRYQFQALEGVAEVASVGGYLQQYQVVIDPLKMRRFNVSFNEITRAIQASNSEQGGRIIEMSGIEYMVRSRGYVQSREDLENTVVGYQDKTPILIKHIGQVNIGGDTRRGVVDLDGQGDVVGGTIVMRHGENALQVINRVKAKITEITPSLPSGVELVITYDRSELILNAINTLKKQLIEEMIIVGLVVLIFLWHFPSAIVPIVSIPVSVLLSFIPFWGMNLTANIMSLAGIAISIGVLVDGAIIEVDNAYKRLQEWDANGRKGDYHLVRLNAIKEVAPSVFFSLLVVAVSFLPIFTLLDQEGRLFTPLAWAKTFTMGIAALLAITLDPALRMLFTRMDPFAFKNKIVNAVVNTLLVGKYRPEEEHPISRVLFKLYDPVCRWVLKHRKTTIALTISLGLISVPFAMRLGSEFMPPLWEGDLLYMPTTMPGISVKEAQELLTLQDKIIKSFPEVLRVFGKAGRIESATDPAPLSMMETVIQLKPKDQWPNPKKTHQELINELDAALKIPGTTNAWTMPIKNRIDMLSTGIRTPLGIKILGNDLNTIEAIALDIEKVISQLDQTRSVFAERVAQGYYLDIDINRQMLARYGLTVADVQEVVANVLGAETLTTVIDKRERFDVNVRLPKEYRQSPQAIKDILIDTPDGGKIPLSYVAEVLVRMGPSMIRNENGLLAGYVYVDTNTSDIGGYVNAAKKVIKEHIQLPSGYALEFSGQYENMQRVLERLKVVVPLTIGIILLLLYWNTHSWVKTMMVVLAVPFSLIGAVMLLAILGYNMSIAVWVGMIALMGLDAETGVFMLMYLDMSYDQRKAEGKMRNENDLVESIVEGAVKRIRPKLMTVLTALLGLLPIMFSQDIGSDLTKRIATPMVGGLISSFLLELCVYPVLYYYWKRKTVLSKIKEQ